MKANTLLAVAALTAGCGDAESTRTADAGAESTASCELWTTPMLADLTGAWPEDCTSLPAPGIFECGEYWLWTGLQTRFDLRPAIVDRLAAIAAAPVAALPENREWAGRMEAYRGMLAMATLLENDVKGLAAGILPALENAARLAPGNANLPLWADTMEIALAWLSRDRARLQIAADRAFTRVGDCGFVNLITLGGTTIGLPLDTGYPQRTIASLDAYRCEGADFCTRNTWRAPYARPGLSFQLAEAYARVGDADRARSYLDDALAAPGADTWAFRPMVQDTRDHLDEVLAEYAALGRDRGAFLSAFSNTANGCVFCHAPHPPAAAIPMVRLPVIADPEPDAMDASTRTDTDPTASDAGAAVSSDDPEVAALLGTWAMELHDARTTTTPIGEQSLHSTTWTLVQVVRREAEPEAIELRSTRCAVDMGQTAGLSLSVDPQVIRALGTMVTPAEFRRVQAKLVLRQQETCVGLGYDAGDSPFDALPESADDPRVRDVDADGHPGLTVTLSATGVTYHMYVAQRACQALELRPTGDTLSGHDAALHGDQRVLGADNAVFATNLPSRRVDDDAAHAVRLVRVDAETTCDDDLPALFR
jgi:hypothetical protein